MKIKKVINGLRVKYYDYMMSRCMDGWESARTKYDESHKKCMYWVKRYDKYEAKLHKVRIG